MYRRGQCLEFRTANVTTRRPDSRKQILENVSATGYRSWTMAHSLTFNSNRDWTFPQPLYLQAQGNIPKAVSGTLLYQSNETPLGVTLESHCEKISQIYRVFQGLKKQVRPECSTLESWAKVVLAAANELRETEVYEPRWSMEKRVLNQCLGQAYVSPGWFLDMEGSSLFPKVILAITVR